MSRLNFYIEDDTQIEAIAKSTSRSKAQVIRDALSLYGYLEKAVNDGNNIYIGYSRDSSDMLLVKQFDTVGFEGTLGSEEDLIRKEQSHTCSLCDEIGAGK